MSAPLAPIRRAVVLGAGVMGAQIAAHLANVGVAVDLLDMVPPDAGPGEAARSRLALEGIRRLSELKPSPVADRTIAGRIRPGNFDDHLERIAEADWVVEAIVEQLEPKRMLLARVEPHLRADAIVSSNTSGIPIREIAGGLRPETRRRFMGTHFFNPPRYLHLLEIIPGPDTDEDALERLRQVAERRLGKGVVRAHDTPNFIANRLGTYATQVTLEEMFARGLGVDEVDVVTGPAMGHPKSATFRTLDVVGLDTYLHVAENMRAHAADDEERRVFAVPEPVRAMVARGWLGQKAGSGFYRKVKGSDGRSTIETLDLKTLAYGARSKPRYNSVGAALKANTPVARARALLLGDDEAAAFAWAVTRRLLAYTARRLPEIADDVASVDRAMRGGFLWELGPFELWDALGFAETAQRLEAEGEALPGWVAQMCQSGAQGFYSDAALGRGGGRCWYPGRGLGEMPPGGAPLDLAVLRRDHRVWQAPDGELVDLGNEVAALVLTGAKDAIGPDTVATYHRALDEVERQWRGLVLTAPGANFCVGANLMMMLMGAQAGEWGQVDAAVRAFQGVNQRAKFAARPVVAAPFGLALGGGAELVLHAAAAQASFESYIGLVEVGAGLIPAGGGVKERWARALAMVPVDAALDLNPLMQWVFETVALAKVGTSAAESRRLGYLRGSDGISANPERVLADAKARVLFLDSQGYAPPAAAPLPVAGREGEAQLRLAIDDMARGGRISEHDRLIAGKLAHVLCGGERPAGALVPEQTLLDLEREAFLSLIGTEKTQARMRHLLQTGRPLRN